MQTPKLAKNILTYLSLLSVMVAVAIGLFIGNDLYPASGDSQAGTITQYPSEQAIPELLVISGAEGACFSAEIYTSLPPKCRTAEGNFIQGNGLPSNVIVIPQGK